MSIRLAHVVAYLVLLLALGTGAASPAAAPVAQAQGAHARLIVLARSDLDHAALRAEVERAGGRVLGDVPDGRMLVVDAADSLEAQLRSSSRARAVARDHVRRLIRPPQRSDVWGTPSAGSSAPAARATSARRLVGRPPTSAAIASVERQSFRRRSLTPDPALGVPGLMWNLERIDAPEAWSTTLGSPAVTVGVADTGLDFTHAELRAAIRESDVVDFTDDTCKAESGLGDADLAAMFGGPEKTDWNGHGTWIGGTIAAALDGQGVNGIAPRVRLVPLKVAQWCGDTSDSSLLASLIYAAHHHIDVVNMSIGGYIDRHEPDGDATWWLYTEVIQAARRQGTLVVTGAGNDHVRIAIDGQVRSHGLITNPAGDPGDFFDPFGLFEAPGGVPGVVDVSATANVVRASTPACDLGSQSADVSVCKPTSDPHQPSGVGRLDQLAYYSNYGPRIDVAAPGGARKFNLPIYDNGGTPGFPYTTDDQTTAFEDFGITSNWATQLPCFVFGPATGFPADQCYATLQGTSSAAPHVSAVLALIASAHPDLRGDHVDKLVHIMQNSARTITGNTTPELSATDRSPDDRTRGHPCVTGFCHLGGPAVPDREAYGDGLVDAEAALTR